MKKILLIEDSRSEALVAVHRIEEEYPGSSIDVCSTLEKALAAQGDYDIIILDLMLPDSADPRATVREIVKAFPDTPIMVCSGVQDPDVVKSVTSEDNVVLWCSKDRHNNIEAFGQRIRMAFRLWRELRPIYAGVGQSQ